MMKNKVTIVLAAVLVTILASLLVAQNLIFYGKQPSFPQMLENVMSFSLENKWDEADKALVDAENRWNKAQFIIAVKYAEQDYSLLNIGLHRLRGSVMARDKQGVAAEGKSCIWLFKNITSISPQP